MKAYTFVLNFGYVESASISFVPFTSSLKYRDAKTALVDLAMFLKDQFLGEPEELKACCVGTKMKDDDAKFCSKCRTSLEEEEFESDRFIQWLSEMSLCNVDSLSGEFIPYNPSDRWQAGDLEGASNQRFVYQAEWVLAAAVGYAHREGRTFEVLCKERTKSKRESFSYY